jgi:hypothetical protein
MGHATLTYIYEDNVGSEKGLAVAANAVHAIDGFLVRELVRRCNYDRNHLVFINDLLDLHSLNVCRSSVTHPMEHTAMEHQFISLRGIEAINRDNVLEFSLCYRDELSKLVKEVLSKPSFDVLTIHDEFKCHPKYMNQMREAYMTILAELADSNVGQTVISEIRNDPSYTITKLSNDLGDKIMKAEYFLS